MYVVVSPIEIEQNAVNIYVLISVHAFGSTTAYVRVNVHHHVYLHTVVKVLEANPSLEDLMEL